MTDSDAGATGERGTAAADADVAGGRIQRLAVEIRLALGFLTILPVLPSRPAAQQSVAASLGWFPLVGFAIGAALGVEDYLLGLLFGHALGSVLIVLSLTAVTGAVHLDGLADTADALGAGRNRTRALEILRDSRIGSFGAIALFFVLSLKILTLATIGRSQRRLALYIAPGLARWAMVGAGYQLDYLRAEGAGSLLLTDANARNLAIACATVVVAVMPTLSIRALGASAVAVAAALLLREFYRRWLGGVTGDLIGAAGELVETALLIAMSI
jgi:adenosylcobinamide-GDP ribazoletransferase